MGVTVLPSSQRPLTSITTRSSLARTIFLALSFLAILAGLLAFHSSTGTHAFAGVPPTHAERTAPASAVVDVESSPGVAPSVVCGAECLLECAIALLACLSLLVLTGIAFFFRLPTFRGGPKERGPTLALGLRATGFSFAQPSLTALCVIRV
jgi:hypothetical protein